MPNDPRRTPAQQGDKPPSERDKQKQQQQETEQERKRREELPEKFPGQQEGSR
jgi:hypothetical protein